MRTAAVAWKLRPVRGDSSYFGHFHDLVSAAHDEGSELVVFPELHVLELLPLARDLNAKDAAKYLVQYSEAVEGWVERISQSSGMVIVAGSHFKPDEDRIKNVCVIGVPDEGLYFCEKNNLTSYERLVWQIEPGRGLPHLPFKIGATVCYDSEFPESGRALAEDGALVQCVPSWTETLHGFHRVRWSCLARAIENQIYVVHASLVGSLGAEPVPTTYGTSAIIAPSVEPFPTQSVLRETEPNKEGVVIFDLDFDKLREARKGGEVTNWLDRSSGDWTIRHRNGETTPEP